jgi:heme-degrading monooxygenase HmoA
MHTGTLELDVATQALAGTECVVLSKFVVANGMVDEVKEAFRKRPHHVDRAIGFVRMEVLSPRDRPEEIWLVTWWTDRDSYRAWHRSHSYRESHKGIPRGLKLARGETVVREFEHVSN